MILQSYRYLSRKLKVTTSKKPIFLNYPASTVCNHECVMCNIHLKKRPNDIGCSELELILSDELFDNIESIGFSGGEPLMKKDLVETVTVICEKLRSLKHFSINTNGNLPKRLYKVLPKLIDTTSKNKKKLNIVFSMDGVGEVHDKVRGKKGAWINLLQSIDIAKSYGLRPSVLMTVHSMNWDEVFKVYSFCKDNDLIPYFGIATVIERLGNEKDFKSFELRRIEKLYISEFIENLSNQRDQKINKRIWYGKLLNMLAYDEKRDANCIAKDSGIYLSDSGSISYCGVYDKPIITQNGETAFKAFCNDLNRNNIYQTMVDKHCNNCMHDYQSEPTIFELFTEFFIPKKVKKLATLSKYSSIKISKGSSDTALLFGWFGTETIGDKAIYSEIIYSLRKQGIRNFVILTLRPFYTERTLLELNENLNDFVLLDITKAHGELLKVGIGVFCGGPIMGFSDLYGFLFIANKLKKQGVYFKIWGAGWGPFRSELYRRVSKKFVDLADEVLLRDIESQKILGKGVVTTDPAYSWVRRNAPLKKITTQNKKLGISLRELSAITYSSGVRFDNVVSELARSINKLNSVYGFKTLMLIPMNTHFVGGDDRVVLNELKKQINSNMNVDFTDGFNGPFEILEKFAKCDLFIGTRFHSCLFSLALDIPTVGIEYTVGGGKIESLFKKYNSNHLVYANELSSELILDKCLSSLDEENIKNIITFNKMLELA